MGNKNYLKLVSLIASLLTIDEKKINENSSLVSLGADSIDFVEIWVAIECEFNISLKDYDSLYKRGGENITIGEILSILDKQRKMSEHGRKIGERCSNCINSRQCGSALEVVCVSCAAFEDRSGRPFVGGAAGPSFRTPWRAWCPHYERIMEESN